MKMTGALVVPDQKTFLSFLMVLSLKKSTVETQMKMTGAFVVPD